jgi:hypothetical protein
MAPHLDKHQTGAYRHLTGIREKGRRRNSESNTTVDGLKKEAVFADAVRL